MRRSTIVLLGFVGLAAMGLAWGLGTSSDPPDPSPWTGGPVVLAAGFILLIVVIAAITNAESIEDWLRAPTPPEIEHPVLGTLGYRNGAWRAESSPLFWCRGPRTGPDPALVEFAAEAWPRLPALEAKAHAYLAGIGRARDTYGAFSAVEPRVVYPLDTPRRLELVLSFDLPDDVDVLDVMFREGEPVDWDQH